jgi:hypothetical protein
MWSDVLSDGAMGKTKSKTRASDQECHSHSPLGSLKEFGCHLSKAFGLSDLHHRHQEHYREDKVLLASFEPQMDESGRYSTHGQGKEMSWGPCKGSETYCQPGPSTPRMPIPKQNTPAIVEEDRIEQQEFTEIHEWWREEINLMVNFNGQRLELDFLPEDSPLKGKARAGWRVKLSQMETLRPKQDPASFFLHPPEKCFQRPEKASQRWPVRHGVEHSQQPIDQKKEAHNKTIDIHNKVTEIRLHDGGKDLILRIEPRLKLRK